MVRKVNSQIVYYGNHFQGYYFKLDAKTQEKIDKVLSLVGSLDLVPGTYLKHISGSGGIYEIRIRTRASSIRLMAIFDELDQVIILNCCSKKTQKIPNREIDKAKRMRDRYKNEKNRN